MFYTDDPARDYDRYCEETEKELEHLPFCEDCGERIMDDYCYSDGDLVVCEECLERNYKKRTEDFMR